MLALLTVFAFMRHTHVRGKFVELCGGFVLFVNETKMRIGSPPNTGVEAWSLWSDLSFPWQTRLMAIEEVAVVIGSPIVARVNNQYNDAETRFVVARVPPILFQFNYGRAQWYCTCRLFLS